MKCELANREQRMEDFLMGKLSRKEADAFEIHVFGCRECLEELRIREQAIALIKEEQDTLMADYAKPKRRQPSGAITISLGKVFQRWQNAWVYAGVAVAVLVIALVARQLLREEDVTKQYAANFVESSRLESVLKQTYQSSAILVSIISPAIGENVEGEVLFQWVIKKDDKEFSEPLELKVMNNREASIHSKVIEGNRYVLPKHFDPGLYYWTLEEQGEMLYLGKFFIRKHNADEPQPK